ncbi:hypothetical protein C2845_PM02G01240 [Panicum miliaceum]|uniref:Uncharacterized protein n=1 Tax=Panicum miliaceum TaxID=4540 RepID=A0A3L6S5V1_PANMI|nr:hypothetical protein C2845_PM02G01240 [Panicum miliaceum]
MVPEGDVPLFQLAVRPARWAPDGSQRGPARVFVADREGSMESQADLGQICTAALVGGYKTKGEASAAHHKRRGHEVIKKKSQKTTRQCT